MFKKILISIIGIILLAVTACDDGNNGSSYTPPPSTPPTQQPNDNDQNKACSSLDCLDLWANGVDEMRRRSNHECNDVLNCGLATQHEATSRSGFNVSLNANVVERNASVHTMQFGELSSDKQETYVTRISSSGVAPADNVAITWGCFNQSDIDAGLKAGMDALDNRHRDMGYVIER